MIKKEEISIATDCSGIGSPEQAIKELGIGHRIVFMCEKDKYAKQTYLANFTPEQIFDDMTTRDNSQKGIYADLYCAGIPCQAFSLAGKRMGELDPRGLLFYNFYDYVKKQQPKYFIIENVKGLLSDAGGKTFQTWLDLMGQSVNTHYNMFNHEDSLLYNLHWTVLNSKDFGVPQNRERVFIIGIRNDLPNNFRFPVGTPLTKRLKDILEPVVAEKYYLSEKMLAGLKLSTTENKIGFINQDTQASAVFAANGTSPTITSGTHGYAMGYIEEPVVNLIPYGSSQDQKCSDINGLSQTLCSGHFNQPKIIVPEATQQGFAIAEEGDSINISNPNSTTPRGRVGKQIANTLETQSNQVVVEPICVAMRGRNTDNPSDRTPGIETEQRLEPNSQGITNTITSVQKDNLIMEPQIIGYTRDEKGKVVKRHLQDNANTLHSSSGSGGNTDQFVKSKHRIRRLTPTECMRLQGFPDSFIKPCSETQQYKMAGNSITVNVIKAILKNLL